ncbi:protein C-mannosyl-transferase DPY19L1-like [Watersipora subatra]|uniref:protein C-mannosyl-transferase DPY19L1-like n=1 Tax=Watersipora subatra TaxID=2589382 RepID=UPI00355AFBF5
MATKKREALSGDAKSKGKTGGQPLKKQPSSSSTKYASTTKKKAAEEMVDIRSKVFWCLAVGILSIVISLAHKSHVFALFEGDKHFSHLSNLEREMAFRTEMGLYYSYFKTIIHAPSFLEGMHEITQDNVTEYPDTINTLKRFNLYPEVILGAAYRFYIDMADRNDWRVKICYQVNRGEGKSPVPSCEGLGEPTYFYVTAVMFLNGFMMGAYFLFGTFLSGSMFGGLLTVLCYFFNHGECTRVMWTPPLRESFAFPMLVVQMLYLSYMLKKRTPTFKDSICLALLIVGFMLPWQFAQFALMTQLVAVLGCFVLGYINFLRMKLILIGHSMGLFISFLMLFGNEMLLSSFYASCILSVYLILLFDGVLRHKLTYKPVVLLVQGVILLIGMVSLKVLIGRVLRVEDDAHIGEILKSKFGDFKSFDTLLYTCAKEFDFLEYETYGKLCLTGLIPSMLLAVFLVVFTLLRREITNYRSGKREGVICYPQGEGMDDEKEHAEVLYNVFQLCAFVIMAVIIMRLKLFATPQLCLVTSLLASPKFLGVYLPEINYQRGLIVLLIGLMAIQGNLNLRQQMNIKGEYSNYPMEDLIEWIIQATPENAVFGGPMPTMANIKLSTLRPIINHPHYEDAGIRERTKKIYTMTSRKSKKELYDVCKELQVEYIVYEGGWCLRSGAKNGCTMPEIWDVEDPANAGKTPLCLVLTRDPTPYFEQVYKNEKFDVFKVL